MADKGQKDHDKEGPEESPLAEGLKKIITAGLGAAFMTEESIRAYLSEVKLPKEVLGMILKNANKSKEELLSRVAGELAKVLSRIDFIVEASRFVEEHKFRITAEIDVVKKKSTDVQNDIRTNVKLS